MDRVGDVDADGRQAVPGHVALRDGLDALAVGPEAGLPGLPVGRGVGRGGGGRTGEHAEGRRTYGHSLIIAPWGEVLADAGDDPGFILAEIDLENVQKARGMVPALRHDRDFKRPQNLMRAASE